VLDVEAELAGVGRIIACGGAPCHPRRLPAPSCTSDDPPGSCGGGIGYASREAVRYGLPLTFLSSSAAAFEADAGRSGLQYMVKAGYDPNASSNSLKRGGSAGEEKPRHVCQAFASNASANTRPERPQKSQWKSTAQRSLPAS